ncbi:MAG: hypothetical protein AB7F22_02525 [Reyranella sp.]
MESYLVNIDIDPEQVVRWLMVERQRGGSGLDVSAWRFNRRCPIEPRVEDRFGDEEREDLSDEVTVARLEIAPTHAGEGWRVVVAVEVELEPIVPGQDSAEDERAPIDLDTFYLEFIRSGRGTASVTAEAESTEAEAHLVEFLRAVETNAHVPAGRRARPGKVA